MDRSCHQRWPVQPAARDDGRCSPTKSRGSHISHPGIRGSLNLDGQIYTPVGNGSQTL